MPQRTGYPRYLLVTEASSAGISLRPVFVGPLQTTASVPWQTSVWLIPRHVSVPPGAFVFTTAGAFAGLVVAQSNAQAVVPAETVIAAAERLLTAEQAPAGSLGIAVQELTPQITSATGIASGVVVVRVDAGGPAAGQLVPTDIIVRIDDASIADRFEWDARLARLAVGESVSLLIRRGAQTKEVQMMAAAPSAPPAQLGVSMRARPRVGAEVIAVDAGSVAAHSGIRLGDIFIRAGTVPSPTPAQVNAAFEALPSGGALLVAVARSADHIVLAIGKP
jgi:S1-C subfamily serine protease